MRLLADQDIYHATILWLRNEGHEVVPAKELGMQQAPDEDLLRKARETGRLFMTRDKGFGALAFLHGAEALGTILLRFTPQQKPKRSIGSSDACSTSTARRN